MEAAAHAEGGYGGVPQSVGKEFVGKDAQSGIGANFIPIADAASSIRKGAGILFLTDDRKALFLKRGNGGDFPGSWCVPGGTTEDGETAEQTAEREATEELGFLPEGERARLITALPNGDGRPEFTTFVQKIDTEFAPQLNGEHVGWAWAPIDQPPEPLHPGMTPVLAMVGANELDIARLMQSGDIGSPQIYRNIALFSIRITGTGAAIRYGKDGEPDEHVWRRPENYLTEEFLQRCNGLPVVWQHPDSPTLNTKEFENRIIGTVFIPFIRGDEVWAIVKIWHTPSAETMATIQLSTSPGVLIGGNGSSSQVVLDDTATLLIEGEADLVDHIAICEVGVWDKGGDPVGVASDKIGAQGMATPEEMEQAKKDAEEKARKDAESGTMGKLLTTLDSLCSKMDSLTSRMDAMERMDATETEEEKKARMDAARKDAEDEEKEEKKARQDAAARLERLELLNRPQSDADFAAISQTQSRCDAVANAFGKTAARPMPGETPMGYARRAVSAFQEHSPAWKGIDLATLPDTAFTTVEAQIYHDAAEAAKRPIQVGTTRPFAVRRQDEAGRTITEWRGRIEDVLSPFKIPARRGRLRTQAEIAQRSRG